MKKNWILFVTFFVVAAIVLLAAYNAYKNPDFWDASATTCISMLVATGLSFYIVQRQNDLRKQKDIFIKLLDSLKDIVDDEKSYKFVGMSVKEILMQKRAMSNKIDFIKKYEKKFGISEDIAFLEKLFEEYAAIIGDYIEDVNVLVQRENELKRPMLLMSQKIFEIMFNLFN